MKKIMLFASALAGLFFAASCQQESLEPVMSGNTVTYTVTVPDALATKGIGDIVSNVNTLHYEVYRTAAANTVDFTGADRLLYHDHATVTNGTAKIELELVNDQNFTVLFWAQVGETNEAYNVEDLTEVTIKTPIKANQVDYAAFSGRDFIKATEKLASKTVQLTRPVAQINLGTTKASLKAFDTPITISSSSMTVAGLSNTFYVAKQAASDAFTSTTVYNEQNVLADSLEVNGTKYVNAGMNYVGFASTVGTPVTVSYVINTTEGDIANTIENVPVKPNYRTNIIGNLITSKTDYTIELLNTWYTPEEVVEVFAVDTAEELQEALESIQPGAEGNIVLEGDIDLNDLFASLTKAGAADSQSITIPAGVEFTIDLNGYTLTGVDETETSFGLITNKGNLTIVNSAEGKTGKIKLIATKESGWSRYSSVISTQPGSTLTVGAGVEIEHLGGTSMSYAIDVLTNGRGTSAVAVIDGATVKSPYRPIRQFLNGTEAVNSLTVKAGSVIKSTNGNKSIWMQDPSANANTGSLVVEEGAELYGNVYISATAGSTEWPVSASVAASTLKNGSEVEISPKELVGYNVVLNDGVYVFEQSWSVNPELTEYTIYTANGLKWVADVVNNTTPYTPTLFDGKTVKLMNDIDLKNEEWIPIGDDRSQRTEFHGVFDGQGHTVKNVKITKKTDRDDENKSSYGLFGNLKGTVKNLTVENVSISGAPKFIAALVGRMNDGLIENCHVKNSSVECNNWTIGGLVGQLNNGKISGCTVEGTTIKGYAAVGAIAGIALSKGERVIEDCSVKNCTILQNGSFGYGNYDEMFGAIVGALYSGELTVNLNACSVENTTIKDVTSTELCGFISEGDKLVVDGYEILAPGLGYKEKTYAVSSAAGLVALSNITIKGNESVTLTADIDLTGVEFNGLSAFNPETPNTFDGQNHVVSNWTYTGRANDMGFIKSWVGTIKNLTVSNAVLRTGGRSAVIAANTYTNIENCHVVNCNLQANYWACGLIAGMHNSGNMKNCSVTNSYIKSTGGTGAITGVLNESAGTRTYESCNVEGCTIKNEGDDPYAGAAVIGLINVDNLTLNLIGCTQTNNTFDGAKDALYGYNAGDNTTVTIE